MIQQLKDALAKSRKNPAYLWYFWQNLNILRDHFPRLWRFLVERRPLAIGGPSGLSRLHVILRTTDFVANVNSSRHLEDAGIVTKPDVIRMGGCSLFPAAKAFAEKFGIESISITIVTDRLSEEGMNLYREAAQSAGVIFETVPSRGNGNGPSFQTQIDIALRDNDATLVLILEDDYLLDKDAFILPFEVMRNHSGIAGFCPHFHPDRVRRQDIGKMVAIDQSLYCRVLSTCCTFFMPARLIRRFQKHLRLYDCWEKGSIGYAWEKAICLAPLGWTLAEHLHRNELSPVQRLLPFDGFLVNGE